MCRNVPFPLYHSFKEYHKELFHAQLSQNTNVQSTRHVVRINTYMTKKVYLSHPTAVTIADKLAINREQSIYANSICMVLYVHNRCIQGIICPFSFHLAFRGETILIIRGLCFGLRGKRFEQPRHSEEKWREKAEDDGRSPLLLFSFFAFSSLSEVGGGGG